MYFTTKAIREAVNTFRGTRQLINELEQDLESRLKDVAYGFGNVNEELEKMTFFVDGLATTNPKIVARFRESEPRRVLSLDILVQYDQDQGEAHREKRVGSRN